MGSGASKTDSKRSSPASKQESLPGKTVPPARPRDVSTKKETSQGRTGSTPLTRPKVTNASPAAASKAGATNTAKTPAKERPVPKPQTGAKTPVKEHPVSKPQSGAKTSPRKPAPGTPEEARKVEKTIVSKNNRDRAMPSSGIQPRTQDQRKSVVRQMERGLADEDADVQNLFGMERAKTRLQLKREKTKARGNWQDPKRKKGHGLAKFKELSQKVAESAVLERPRTTADELLMGNVTIDCPATAKVVRIFTSSTFTDTMHERNVLMEEAYPRLKALCQQLGYDFQVVDMRWGVRDQATDDHMGTELCLRELKQCQKLSTGPNFVTLMSHKYGYTDFPRVIEESEFVAMMEKVEHKDVLNLFKKWYQKDENAIPPAYIVSPISSNLPDFLSQEPDRKKAAKDIWWRESEAMQAALEKAATKVFSPQKARKYIRSVTESEVAEGILTSSDPGKHCLWLRRNIKSIEKQESSYLLSRYIECTGGEEKWQKSREMLSELKEKVEKKLSDKQILRYDVPWNSQKGVDPISDHKAYLQRLSGSFVEKLSAMIVGAVEEKQLTEDVLLEEVIQHTLFCQAKCDDFYGRERTLQEMKSYTQGMSNELMVIHGKSGSGKTSIMAMAAKSAGDWCSKRPAVVIRFIGTTPGSSTLTGLLSSITQQIRKAYNMSWAVSADLTTLIDEFQLSLFLATPNRPLVLILDSLDQLDPSHNSRQLQWLPSRLRPNVKIIVSTLPEDQYECLPILETMVRAKENMVAVPKMPDKEVAGIINKWLGQRKRKLTDDQRRLVLSAFAKCPFPLFLKLSFDEAVSWTSFALKRVTVLEPTVRASINSLFQKLERAHGTIFVSRALGYLTTARSGLTETELEDVVSCDDDVLNDVYLYWTPPMRRLPPLLLVRLRTDLSQYLVDRGADGARVMSWYHRQFVEVATDRYCSDASTNRMLHAALADFFSGMWADGRKKPYTTIKGESGEADRVVASQPLQFGTAFNLRKLNNLPYHRIHAKQVDLLQQDCLCNFEFLLSKLKATTLWTLIDDFALARKSFPENDAIAMIADVLQLSQEGLLYDPHQLIPQLLGRCKPLKSLESFLEDCRRYPVPYILPNKQILAQPGGQLIHSMAGHKGEILSLDMTANGRNVVTCGNDNTIRLWNVREGKQIRIYDGMGKVSKALFCNMDKFLLIEMNKKLTVRSVLSGEKVYDLAAVSDDYPMCLAAQDKTLLVVFSGRRAVLYDLVDGVLVEEVASQDHFEFKFPAIAVGSKNYAAVTDAEQVYIGILDLKKKQMSHMVRGFEPFLEVGLEESIQYEVDEMAITVDERYVVYGNIYTNDIVFLDIRKQTKERIIKGDPSDYIKSLKCAADGKSLYLVTSSFVNFIDIKTGRKREELEHGVDVISACTRDMKMVVTAAEDSNVRVWDRTRMVQKISQSPGISVNRIRSLLIHENSRYMIGFGFKTREADSQFLFVFDVITNTTVRERLLDTSVLKMEMLSSTELLVLPDYSHKLKVVDLTSMKITQIYQGTVAKEHVALKVLKSRGEVIALSRGCHNIKIYDTATGKVSTILDTGLKDKLEGFSVNEAETILVANSEADGPQLIFDIQRRQLLHAIQHENAVFTEDDVDLTPDGKFLLFTVENVPPVTGKVPKDKKEEIYIEVWDVQRGDKASDLVDTEYYVKYLTEREKSGLSTGVDSFKVLNNDLVLVAHDDYIMRLFEIRTGRIQHRLMGHSTSIEIVYNPKSPYFLSYGSWTEENALRVWDRESYTCLASYTLDKTVLHVTFSADGKFILATTGKPAEVIMWRLHNFQQDMAVQDSAYPQIFKGDNNHGYLDLTEEEEVEDKLDPQDPDKDVADDDDFGEEDFELATSK